MKSNDTVFNNDDLQRLEAVIKNVKDPNAKKKLYHLQKGLKRKIKDKEEATVNRNRNLKTAYFAIIPFAIILGVVGLYYFLKKDKNLKEK